MTFIRADANENIGAGHVMRCLSVADALVSQGESVTFITADHRGDDLIRRRGFETICLESNWARLDDEIEALIDLVKNKAPSLLIVDSYYVTNAYFRDLSCFVRIAYFDDMNAERWDVDHLINYNIFAEALDYTWYSESAAELLLGPRYAPLRKEFRGLPPHGIRDDVTNILVSAGGADPEEVTERLIETVCPKWCDITFHFIVGALNPRIKKIRQMEGENVVLHINEKNMSELMQRCDVAISAAGSTLYELSACGIPAITYTLADNQIIAAEQFSKQKLMLSAGDVRRGEGEAFSEAISVHLRKLADSKEKREYYSRRMQTLVDGNGAERIVKELLKRQQA